MAEIKFKKGDEYLLKLSKLANGAIKEVCGPAIHDAAGLVADNIILAFLQVPTDERFGTEGTPAIGPKKIQKKALYDCYGITKMEEDANGFLNVKIGFDGYSGIKTKKWPNGQPNQLIARSIESGTSYMVKHPFVKEGIANSRKKALEIMKKKVAEGVEKIMK